MQTFKEWADKKYINAEYCDDFYYEDMKDAFEAGKKAMKDEISTRLKNKQKSAKK